MEWEEGHVLAGENQDQVCILEGPGFPRRERSQSPRGRLLPLFQTELVGVWAR